MTMHRKIARRGRGFRPLPRLALAAALLFPVAACDSALDVSDPDVTRPESLLDPSNLPGLRATVIGDFGVAFGGAGQTNGLAINSGLLGDEFYHSGTYGTNRAIDIRDVGDQNTDHATAVRNLYRARRSAMVGVASYAQNSPNTAGHAEMASLEGYVYLFFAENFCGAVPFSTGDNPDFEYGPPENRQQMLDRATASFDQALAIADAAKSTAQQNLARVGKARTLLDQGRFAEAAAVARTVPDNFFYTLEFSENTTRQNNGIWGLNHNRREIGLSNLEGGNGLSFRTGTAPAALTVVYADPRLPWSFRNGSAAGSTIRHWFQNRYAKQGAPLVLASGLEARLIEAEAALSRGQSGAYLSTINALRNNAPALLLGMGMEPPSRTETFQPMAPLTDPGTEDARVDQFFKERSYWLFGTAHRLGDMRRLVTQYGRPVNRVFPTGNYTRVYTSGTRVEGTYGTDVSLPVVFDEQNNPAFKEAVAQCNTAQA